MKRFFLLMITVAIAFNGCSKDNDSDKDTGGLSGIWDAVSNYELNNGTWELCDIFYDEGLTYEFSNGKLTMYEDDEKDGVYDYSYNSTTKEFVVSTLVCKVEKLTSTELIIIGLTWDEPRMSYKTVFRKR